MFFIMGINNGRKKLNFSQSILCPCCGYSAQIEIIKTFTYFMFFFIPLFRWNKRYFASMPCCGAVCEIDGQLGRSIEKGETDHINPADLNFSRPGGYAQGGYYGNYAGGYSQSPYGGPISRRANINAASPGPDFADSYVDEDGLKRVRVRTCGSCGYETGEDFSFCPKCGKPL